MKKSLLLFFLAAAPLLAETPFGLIDETNTLYTAAETRALVAAATNSLAGDVSAAAADALAAATNYTDAAIASIPPPDLSAYQRHDSAALGADSFAASDGGAWGDGATATATGAYQIGEGVNSTASTLQFRGHRLLDASGTIPDERLPDAIRRGVRFADASHVLWRDLAERVEVLEDAQ